MLKVTRLLSVTILMSLLAFGTAAAANQVPWLKGVNLAGAEFGEGSLPGEYNRHYIYPNQQEVNYFKSKGMNVVRMPFRWERIQRSQYAALDATELQRMKNFVNGATNSGVYVILDPHNYARYYGEIIGGAGSSVSKEAFADFWRRLALEFRNNDKVIFGLVNEPHSMPTEVWLDDANAAIAAIRSAGAGNQIMVPGVAWTGAWNWLEDYYGTPNGVAMLNIVDPGNNYVYEVHQYLNTDHSGNENDPCISATIGSERLKVFTKWLKDNNRRGFLGEFGGRPSDVCIRAFDDMLDYVEANADVWTGWAYWAAGPWWGDYPLSIEPENGQDKPQMAALANRPTPGDGGGGDVTVSVMSVTVNEVDRIAAVPLVLSRAVNQDVQVKLHSITGSAQPGQDFYGFTRTATIEAGSVRGAIDVDILNDDDVEDEETFQVRAYETSQGTIAQPRATVTIIDDESVDDGQPRLRVSDARASEGDGVVTVDLQLTNASNNAVTVSVFTRPGTAAGGGVDYRGFLRTVRLEPGMTQADIDITLINDTQTESDESFLIVLRGASGAVIADDMGRVSIVDDD